MKLIIGLGNTGRAYAKNRHNVGFQCLDYFARRHGLYFTRRTCRSHLAKGRVAGVEIVLAKPQTYMNLSGQAVGPLVSHLNLSLSDLLVIYDDLDLPLGTIRIRDRGSAGGHKGMQSIIGRLGSRDFPRLRVGIGRPEDEDSQGRGSEGIYNYVLSDFTASERALFNKVCPFVAESIECIITEGIPAAMNRFNRTVSNE